MAFEGTIAKKKMIWGIVIYIEIMKLLANCVGTELKGSLFHLCTFNKDAIDEKNSIL